MRIMESVAKHVMLGLMLVCLNCTKPAMGQLSMDVYAHRGFRGLHPENTIQAMKKALAYGAILEFDLAVSKDKQVIVSHDAVMNEKITAHADGTPITHEGKKHILYQMDYADIRTYDVGAKPNPDFPEQQQYAAYIPLLSELIDSVEAFANTENLEAPRYFIETKLNEKQDGILHPGPEEFVHLMMKVIDAKGIRGRLTVQSFDPRTLQVLHREFPDVKLTFLAKANSALAANMEWLGFTPDFYSINAEYIDAALVAACREAGTELIIGNCNDYTAIKGIYELGVHRVISDFPLDLLAAKAATSFHHLAFQTPADLHQFFAYKAGATIVSGHRGTIENGLAENSIEGMEAVLQHTPAFFEIDPRLTKDSVVVLMHDATLDRTTTGTGKVSDYTWAELQQLRLKDREGNITPYQIPTLDEVIEWARGKTVLNLDQKDVPVALSAEIIRKHNAYSFVIVTVHSPEQARFYLDQNGDQMLSAHILTPDVFEAYRAAGIPFNRMIAYIGPEVKPENQEMYRLLNNEGVMCMISAAPKYDKLSTEAQRAEAYQAIFADGASILESDLPIEVGEAIR